MDLYTWGCSPRSKCLQHYHNTIVVGLRSAYISYIPTYGAMINPMILPLKRVVLSIHPMHSSRSTFTASIAAVKSSMSSVFFSISGARFATESNQQKGWKICFQDVMNDDSMMLPPYFAALQLFYLFERCYIYI